MLFISQFYPPEIGAAQNRLSDLTQRLAAAGHTVSVLTAMPSYPQGIVFREYRGRKLMEEYLWGVRVIRTWIYITKRKSFFARLATYFSFVFSSLVGALLRIRRQDIVVVESPPLFLGISGLVISYMSRAKLVLNVSDLWPNSAVDLGLLRSPFLIRASTALEEFLYRRSHLVTAQTRGIVRNIQKRIATPLLLYTNGADPSAYRELWSRDKMRCRLGFSSSAFLAVFAGLHGLVYDFETILAAAEQLSAYENIRFAFFGEGPEKPRWQRVVREKGLNNVHFFPPRPKEDMPEVIQAMDISIGALKRADLFRSTLPARLFESMAAGVPVAFAIEGEARELVEQAEGGICVSPQDPDALAAAILRLEGNPDLREAMGQRARQFIATNYDRRVIARQVEQALIRLIPKPL